MTEVQIRSHASHWREQTASAGMQHGANLKQARRSVRSTTVSTWFKSGPTHRLRTVRFAGSEICDFRRMGGRSPPESRCTGALLLGLHPRTTSTEATYERAISGVRTVFLTSYETLITRVRRPSRLAVAEACCMRADGGGQEHGPHCVVVERVLTSAPAAVGRRRKSFDYRDH